MNGDILFISHRVPFPPDRGDKIRSHHILKRLAEHAPVHVATFADDDADLAEEAELAAFARSHCMVLRNLPLAVAGLRSLIHREPVSLSAFHHSKLARYIAQTIAAHPVETIYVFSGQMGQYVPGSFGGKVIVDLVDVDSAKFEAYAAQGRGFHRWVNAREAALLRREEELLAMRSDHTLLISAEEAALFASRLTTTASAQLPISVLGNGIDSAFYAPAAVKPEPVLAAMAQGRLIFTGQMDYPPNIGAVIRLAERILPRVRSQCPEASLHIVGRNPVDKVCALAGLEGCHVWGRVDDMRTWLAAADVAVVPLEIARGVQNKVLEAMAMGMPVVLTPAAATGIAAKPGLDFAVADDDAEIAAHTIGLLRNPQRAAMMGSAARAFITAHQGWEAALAPLDRLVSSVRPDNFRRVA